jgi:hypothetical protein
MRAMLRESCSMSTVPAVGGSAGSFSLMAAFGADVSCTRFLPATGSLSVLVFCFDILTA